MREAKKRAKKKKSSSATHRQDSSQKERRFQEEKAESRKKVANTAKDKRITAQQSIPYHEMGEDGICRVQDKFYSKTSVFMTSTTS